MDSENPAPEVRDVTDQPPETEAAPKAKAPIAIVEGSFSPQNANELVGVIEKIHKGGGFPTRFKTPESRIAAYNLAHSLMGSRWQLCLNNISEIKGQMTIYGELPGALAEQTKEVAEKRVYCVDANYAEICVQNKNLDATPYAGVCEIKRKGRALKSFTYTINEATQAGQYPPTKYDRDLRKSVPNEDSPWWKWPKVMLMRKAMAMAIKFEFPDAMVGVPVAEYDFDLAPDLIPIKDVSPRVDRAAELNDKFKNGGSNGQRDNLRSEGATNHQSGNPEIGRGASEGISAEASQ